MNIEQYINNIFSIVNELESLPGRLEAMQSEFLDLLLPIVATMAAFLLGLSIASVVLGILGTFPLLMMGLELAGGLVFTEMLFAVIAIDVVAGVLGLAVGIAKLVFHHMSVYDVYCSCMPKYSVLFLILGIFLGFLEPFFLMACRNKDDGLRKEEPKAAEKPAPEQKPQPSQEQKPEPQPEQKGEPAPAEEKQSEIPAAPEKKEPELPPVIHLPAAGGMDDTAGNK